MSWPVFLVVRLARLILLLLGVTALLFAISHMVPIDPVVANLGQRAAENPEVVTAFRHKWGLDQPLWTQYGHYLGNLLRGDLGQSLSTARPVSADLAQYLPATIELATFALMLSLLIGLPLGILSAVRKNRALDHLSRLIAVMGISTPVFWFGLLALFVFYFQLGWLPGAGRLSIGLTAPHGPTGLFLLDSLLTGQLNVFGDAVTHLLLPAAVLASYITGLLIRVTRASVLTVLQQDFVRTARAKGASEARLLLRHVLKNALTGPITIMGLAYAQLLTGAVLTEVIFAWPGIGRYAFQAATKLDLPAITGVALVIAVSYSLVNLVVDVAYTLLDPRIKEI